MTRKTAAVAPKRSAPAFEPAISGSSVGPQLASDEAAPVPSHVHQLQDHLARRLDTPAPAKWSARASIGLVLLTCGAFWVAAFLAMQMLCR